MLLSQIYCIFLFFCAVSLFGTIVAEVNEIVAHLNAQKKDLDEVLEPYLSINPRSQLISDYDFPKTSIVFMSILMPFNLKSFEN